MPRQTLTTYIKRASDEMLDKMFHCVIAEMNRRKADCEQRLEVFDTSKTVTPFNASNQAAAKQNVDVGFWDSEGNYTEDIQPVDSDELAEILREENETEEIK